ncbi:MAG: S-layer homology domain-containing protein [Huintestinicola sp.]|uniref:S-layer homology domain-containing protein n=1 Tax=Huintestinicola sp. TaxID=2981661 RepID=UPI003F1050E6
MKRKIAALMAIVMAAGAVQSVPFTVFAESETASSQSQSADNGKKETSEEEQMKNALALVKSRIDIPEEYSNFSYRTGVNQGMKTYSFTWTDPTGNKSYSAQVEGGIITDFNAPYEYSWKPAISSQKPSYFVNKAMSWVYKVNPSMKGFLTKSSVSLSITSSNVSVQFKRSFGGIPVGKNSVSVSIDKLTGEVTSYYANWWQDAEFVAPSDVLSQEEIKEIYCGEVTIKPWYHIYNDSATGKKKTCIVYEPQNSYVYDALTGKHSSMDDDYNKFMDTDKYDRGEALDADVCEEEAIECEDDMVEAGTAAIPATGVSLTEEELAAAADLSTMLTSEQFKALIVKDKYMDVTEKYLVQNFDISRNDDAECGYAISCNMMINNKTDNRSVNITADAKSGKIMSFYAYDYDRNENKAELNVKKANTLANAVLKYYFGDISGEYKADTDNTAPVSDSGKNKQTSRGMKYNRYVNNIQVASNNIYITVNSAGKVTSVSCSHDRDVDFGDGLIINKETALKLLCEQQDMTLRYNGFIDLESKPHTYLQYSMDRWTLNGVTGKLCDHNGQPVAKTEEQPENCPYTDISKSPYKKEIEALYEHNVRIYEGKEFKPAEKMTFSEFERLLDIITGYGYEPMPLEDIPEEEGEMSATAKAPVGEFFTRMTLAKEFTRAAKVDNCAKYTSIFKSPFTDVSAKDKDMGYAALAYGMGAISCGKDGKFYPNAYVTREYAYHCAYNYIKNSMES